MSGVAVEENVRLLPSAELPPYTYVPGTDTPHPIRDPRGHRIGTVGEVLADLNDEPRYVSVNMGLFGLRSVLIPV